MNKIRSTRKLGPKSKQSASDHLSILLRSWMMRNMWSVDQVAKLSSRYTPSRPLGTNTIKSLLTGTLYSPSPDVFKALAQLHNGIRLTQPDERLNNKSFDPKGDIDLLSSYSSIACHNQDAEKASWWFALYVKEIDSPLDIGSGQCMSDRDLSRHLAKFLRSSLSEKSQDPLEVIQSLLKVHHEKGTNTHYYRQMRWICDSHDFSRPELDSLMCFCLNLYRLLTGKTVLLDGLYRELMRMKQQRLR